ncbi:MAG: metallophosphoesterase [Firmicutes bacterium]|nr:metallophosphoesterase [Bacillota bacterium]
MEIYALSDWHLSGQNPKPMDIFGGAWENYVEVLTGNLHKALTSDDILLIAGDISWAMRLEDARPDLDFIAGFPGKKVILRGNHDYWWQSISAVRKALHPTVFALQNDSVKIFCDEGNVVIAGSRGWLEPDGTVENDKIYARELARIKMSLEHAAKSRGAGDRLVVMTHYPPFGAKLNTPVTDLIASYAPDAVVYGHIHGKFYKKDVKTVIGGIPYYLTSCDILENTPLKVL